MVHFEYGFFFFILSADEDIASGGDVDIAGIAQFHRKGDGEEFIPGSVDLEGGDGNFSLRIGDFRFEEGEDGRTTSESGLSFGYLFARTREDEGIVVSEGGGRRDIERSGNGLPLILIDLEGIFGEMYPVDEVISRFGIEEPRGTLFSVGLELHDGELQGFGVGSLILDTNGSRDAVPGLHDEVNGKWGGDEAEVSGGLSEGREGGEHEKEPNEEE